MRYAVPEHQGSESDTTEYVSAAEDETRPEEIMDHPMGSDEAAQALSQRERCEMMAELQQLRKANETLLARLGEMTTTTAAAAPLASSTPAIDGPRGLRQRMPALAEFGGERAKYKAWRTDVELKLQVDGAALGDEEAKVRIVQTALTGTAKANSTAQVQRMLASGEPRVADLLAYLDQSYASRFEENRAHNRLTALSQGQKSFAAFFPEFDGLLAEAGGADWPHAVRKNYLNAAVAPALRDACVAAEEPAEYEDLVAQYHRVATRMEENDRLGKRGATRRAPPWSPPPTAPTADPAADLMEWEPTPAPGARTLGVRTTNLGGHPAGPGLPDDGLLRGKRAKWAPDEEIARRRAAGACFRCARVGCRVDVCPLAAARRPGAPAPRTNARSTQAAYVPLSAAEAARVFEEPDFAAPQGNAAS